MAKYNLLLAIPMSFYSKDLYQDVASNWGARAFLYLFIVVLLSWVPATILMQLGLNEAYEQEIQSVILQIPVMKMKDGKISTPENRPYLIKSSKGKTIAIIDTSGQYQTVEEAKTKVLVTETALLMHPKHNEYRTYQLPSQMKLDIVPETVNRLLNQYKSFAWIFFIFFFVIFGYLYRVIQALIYSIFGKIIASSTNVALSYDKILAIVMVAVTPAIVLSVIFDLLQIEFPFQLFFYLCLSLVYIYFGIKANKIIKKT